MHAKKDENSYFAHICKKGRKFLFCTLQNTVPLTGYIATFACVGTLWTKGALSPPLCSKRGPTYTCGARQKERRKTMKEMLENLFRDWCFEQNINPDDKITFADVASFFDYVELMTDYNLEEMK